MTKRAYDNRRREAQRAATADRIVEAMVETLAEGQEDVAVAEIARASGVSLRTVYQHFPDKAARVAAIDRWLSERVQAAVMPPRTTADLPRFIEETVDHVLDNEMWIRAQMHPGLARAVRTRRKQPQIDALRRLFSQRLSSVESSRLAALVVATIRAEAILDLRDVYSQSRAEIKKGLCELIEGLLRVVIPAEVS